MLGRGQKPVVVPVPVIVSNSWGSLSSVYWRSWVRLSCFCGSGGECRGIGPQRERETIGGSDTVIEKRPSGGPADSANPTLLPTYWKKNSISDPRLDQYRSVSTVRCQKLHYWYVILSPEDGWWLFWLCFERTPLLPNTNQPD